MYYYFIILSALLFSLQFLFNQQFEKINGDGFASALAFSIYSSVTGFILLFCINGFKIHFSVFSFLIAFIYSCVNIAFNSVSVKAFTGLGTISADHGRNNRIFFFCRFGVKAKSHCQKPDIGYSFFGSFGNYCDVTACISNKTRY